MLKSTAPERIARTAFGGADILKVQSQHERFLREINTLSTDKKAIEIKNAINFLIANKSDYWLETAHLLQILLDDSEKEEGLYLKIEPNSMRKDFCKKYLNIPYNTAISYIKVIKDYEKYGFKEEQIRVLGFSKTKEILKQSSKLPSGNLSEYSYKNIDELKKLKYAQIKPKKQKSTLELLKRHWNKSDETEKKEFLRFLNETGENPSMDKKHSGD